jgi:hypothetical protein
MTTCIECGKKSKYRLCSNECARSNQGARAVPCAVCYVDPKTGRRGTNQLTQLCDECRRDPVNAGWSETWAHTKFFSEFKVGRRKDPEDERLELVVSAERDGYKDANTIGTVSGMPFKPATERERGILILMADDKLTTGDIAKRANCSQQLVSKVLTKYSALAPVTVANDRFIGSSPVPALGEQHRRLVELAWMEYRATRQCSSGNGEPMMSSFDAPHWFWWDELGFGTGQGPSLAETLRTLTATNRLRRRIFMGSRPKLRRVQPRQRARHIRAALTNAAYAAQHDAVQ